MLQVPVGTLISEVAADGEGLETIEDLTAGDATAIVARGGRGGRGNARFATSTRQAPHFAQQGAAGQTRKLRLELKLLADVGLIGLPSAGKSTLLRAWTAARPKVAAYPFTTLEPSLGVVEIGHDSFVAADMPGLIEGASGGAGLGQEFLRHIERTRVLVHVIDMTADDPSANRRLIDDELASFGHGLSEKPQLLALNKVDDVDARARFELLTEVGAFGGEWLPVSGLTMEGTRALAERSLQMLRAAIEREQRQVAREPVVLRPRMRGRNVEATRAADGVAVVVGPTAEWWAQTFDVGNQEAREELLSRLRRIGVGRALARLGVVDGERIRIGDVALTWET